MGLLINVFRYAVAALAGLGVDQAVGWFQTPKESRPDAATQFGGFFSDMGTYIKALAVGVGAFLVFAFFFMTKAQRKRELKL